MTQFGPSSNLHISGKNQRSTIIAEKKTDLPRLTGSLAGRSTPLPSPTQEERRDCTPASEPTPPSTPCEGREREDSGFRGEKTPSPCREVRIVSASNILVSA